MSSQILGWSGWIFLIIVATAALCIGHWVSQWRRYPAPRKNQRPEARVDPLLDLRSLLRTPEVMRPYVFCCLGCGVHVRNIEEHDFAACRARKVAEDGGDAA